MGTITERRLKSGKIVYTAQVRIMREGRKASASATFDRRPAAVAWMKRKEAEARGPGRVEKLAKARSSGASLSDAIDQYLKTSTKSIGRTKAQVLRAIKA